MNAKKLQQNELGEELPATLVGKWANGYAAPSSDNLDRLAKALDATMDFLHGDEEYYYSEAGEDYAKSAAHLSFRVFRRDPRFTEQQRERCRRVLDHPGAPTTAAEWRDFAEMVELAIGPAPPQLGIAKGKG